MRPRSWCAVVLLVVLAALVAPAAASAVSVGGLSEDRAFSPDGDGYEDSTYVSYYLDEKSRVSIVIRDSAGVAVRTIESEVPHDPGWTGFAWDGLADGGDTLPDGVYDYSVSAETLAGDHASATGRLAIDTAPVASLTSPTSGEKVSDTTNATVIAAPGRTLSSVSLYGCTSPAGWPSCYFTYGLGAALAPDVAGSWTVAWDTSVTPAAVYDLYALVTYTDGLGAAHQYATASVSPVTVQRAPTITSQSADRAFSPDGDGQGDSANVSFSLTAPASVTIAILDGDGTPVRQLETDAGRPEGSNSFEWDGRDDSGAIVADGEYAYTIRAEGSIGDPVTAEGRIGVDTAAIASLTKPTPNAELSGTVPVTVSPAAGRTLTSAYFYACEDEWWCYSSQWIGYSTVQEADGGLTALWDTEGARAAEYLLYAQVTFEDDFGETHVYALPATRVSVTRSADVAISSPDRAFSPDGDGQEDETYVYYSLTAPARVTVEIRTEGGSPVRTVRSAADEGEGWQWFAWDGRDENGRVVADGSYRYVVRVESGDSDAVEREGSIAVDTAPVATLVAPEVDASVHGTTPVRVEPAPGRTLEDGRLYRCVSSGADNCWSTTEVAYLWGPGFDGSLESTWDTAHSPAGTVGLEAWVTYADTFGERHTVRVARRDVTVVRAAEVVDLGPDRAFSPNGDSDEDTGGLSFRLTAPASTSVTIADSEGEEVRALLVDEDLGEGTHYVEWDGRDEAGDVVADGTYEYTISALSADRTADSKKGHVGVDTAAVATLSRPAAGDRLSGTTRLVASPAAGRTLERADFYTCDGFGGSECWWLTGLGSSLVTDFDGSIGIDWDTRTSATGGRNLLAVVEWKDTFGSTHYTRTPVVSVDVTRSVGVRKLTGDRYMTPNGDGSEDEGVVSYALTTPASVTITVRTGGGALVRTLASAAARPEGSNNATWDGLDDDGQPVPDGSYQYTIVARGAEGDPAQVSGRIGVQRAAPGRIRRPEADDTLSADAPFSFEPASGVTTLSVRGCVIDRCATIGAAASDNSWRATLDVRGLATGPASVTAEIVWRDGFGARHVTSLSRAVTVDNTAPALDFDVTPSSGLAPLASAASFTTSMSSGRPLSYTVDFGDATAVETGTVAAPYERVSLDHLYARAGTYRTRVSVTDGAGHHAQRSRYVTVTEPPNRRPSADLSVTPSSGSAPLDVAAGISAADADGDSLTYRLDWGDGSVASGPVPRGDVPHRYARPGTYLARLAVSDGALDRVVSRRIVVVLPEPLHAHAGEDIVTIAGEGVHLDGAGSRPSELIDGYTWSLGDGSTASGRAVDHVYTAPGTYSAKLTVEVGGDQHSDTLEVTVLERSVAPRVTAHVRSGGAPLPGADVLVVDADGTRVAAVADESGEATLSLPDGDHTVFASRDGYRPRGEPVHVAGGRGEVTLDLEAGEAVSTSLTSERLDIEQIKALGIDPEDPANQHVFEFEAHLAFEEDAPPEVELRGYTVGGSDGEGEPWKWEYYAHDAWQPCAADCSIPVQGGTAYPTVHYTEGIPTLQWLIIPFRASFLKEFFSVQMLVQNLAGPGVTLSHGAASLELPEGLTLAPTADPQSVTQALEDIPSGGSRSVTWTVRGDDEGEYQPTATFSGTLEPIGRPVSYRAVTAKPFKVWAGSALKLIVEPESRVDRLRPYRVRVGLKNVSDVPVYNPAIELLRDGRLNYIEQPRERLRQGAAAVDPGDTFWTDEFVLVPKITGRLRPRYSFVKKTAGDVSLESSIAPVAQRPVGSIEVRPNKGRVVLDWQPVAGADSYQVFRTPNLDTDFPADPVPNVRFLGPTKAVVSNVDPAAAAQLYAVSSVRNGRNVLAHPVVSAESTNTWQSPTARVRYSAPCGSDRADIELVFDDPDFDLRDYHVEVNGVTRTGRASGHHHVVTVPDVPITESGTEVKAWASNTETAQGDHGPPTTKTLRPCRYVALGDSFSSGEGVPQFEDGTATDDNGIFDGGDATNKCHRSPRAYGRLVAVPDALKKNMEFVACSGAKIGDLLEGNQGGYTYKGNPEGPQINHLDGGVRLATMTIGGNDAYFADVLKQCVLERLGTYFLGRGPEGLVPSTPFPFTITCRSDWDERVATEIQALRKSLPDTYRRLRAEMAPGGRLLVLTYPEIFPRKPQYCWGIRSGDVQWISSAQRQANDVIKEAAHEAGVEVVDLGDRFEGHDVCDVLGDTWFNGPTFEAALHGGNAEHSFHPNRRGQEEMANAVNAYLAGPQPGSDYLVRQGDTLDTTRTVAADQSAVTFSTHWPGSDVQMEIETPSGEILGRGTERGGLVHDLGPTYETYTLERPEPGIYKIHLTGLDVAADGEETRLSFNQVPERNVPPSPLYTASAGHGPPPELSVRFDAAKAYDLDGEITGYEWDFGDGASASGATATHVYRGTGSYQPKLTVTDNEGKSASYGAEPIVVTTPPEARDDIATTEGGEPLELASPGVLANDRDKEGGTLTAFLVTGPAHGTATLDANGKLRYVAADGFAGRDQLSYRVIDSHGEPSGIATVELRVTPDTILDSGPAGLTADATPTFGFRSTRATGFECRVDAGAWQACSSPKTSEALSEGAHSFDVRAKSSGGDVDPTPAARSLKVDTVAPSAVITSGTSGPSRSRSAEFAFSSEDGARFDCRLGTGEWAACGSPARYTDLAEQEYTFRVRARDAAGNVSPQPPTRTFTVDLKAPTTTISSGPAGVTSDARPEFAFVSEPGATFECRVDAGAFVACESPFSTAALQDGQHTFAVRATDAAGNVASAPAERAFALDTVAPKVEIDSGPHGATKEPAPEFGFKSHEVGAELECRVDAAAFAACTSPIRVAALPDGAHTFAVRGRDIAGNVSVEPATRSFSIDTTAPQTTIVSGPVAAYSGVTAAFDFIADDPAATFECRLTAAFAACASPFVSAPLPAGSYTFAVRAKDALGNLEATPASQSVTVTDRPPPDPPGGGGSGGTGGGGSGGTGGGGSGETGGGGSGETGGGGSGETGGGGSGETGGAAGGGRDGGTGGGGPGGTPGAGGDGATARAPTFAGRPGKTARVDSKGRFRSGLRVDCPLTGPACTVVVTIRRAAGRRASLGRAAITLAPGRRQLVSGRLTAAGLKLARARRGLRARVMVQATAGGVAAQRSFSLTLRR